MYRFLRYPLKIYRDLNIAYILFLSGKRRKEKIEITQKISLNYSKNKNYSDRLTRNI